LKESVRKLQHISSKSERLKLVLMPGRKLAKRKVSTPGKKIGAALSIGKQVALRSTGVNQAWGSTYSKAFGKWMHDHGFGDMRPSTRSVAIELHENIDAIEPWRDADKRRHRLVNPQSIVKRWRNETQPQAQKVEDAAKTTSYAWQRFVALMEALPAEAAAPIRQEVLSYLAA
jgi:hypothetical protein